MPWQGEELDVFGSPRFVPWIRESMRVGQGWNGKLAVRNEVGMNGES